MKLTIITPVHRIQYLGAISKTIPEDVRWLCIFDDTIPTEIRDKATCLSMPKVKSSWGVAKINFALDFVSNGYVYILDDDTILHSNFQVLLTLNSSFDFIHFNQCWKNGEPRVGGIVKKGKIDIGNFIVSRELIEDTYLEDGNMPDGAWAEKLYVKAKNPLYLNKTFSIYNYLR